MKNKMNLKRILVLFLALVSVDVMADIIDYKALSISQSTKFTKSEKEPFGQINSLRIGKVDFEADMFADNPILDQKGKVVGILTKLSWNGGLKDPIKITFNASKTTMNKLKTLMSLKEKELYAEVGFQVFSYDVEEQRYFTSLKTLSFKERGILNTIGYKAPEFKGKSLPVRGHIISLNDKQYLEIDTKEIVTSGKDTYRINLVIHPDEKQEQNMYRYQDSVTAKKLKWGKDEDLLP